MPYRRWDPFFDIVSLHQELFGDEPKLGMGNSNQTGWTPSVDIYESDQAYVLKAEIPGVAPDKVKVEFRNRRLVIAGERQGPRGGQERRYHRVERVHGPFIRQFILPDNIDCEAIEAHYQDGVLEVVVPKTENAKPRCISVGEAG